MRFPKILIIGHGRAGKDEACVWFGTHTRLVDAGATSSLHVADIARDLGVPPEQAYRERSQNRAFWRKWLDDYRRLDPAILSRECLALGDVYNGVRSRDEFDATRAAGLVDLVVWVDNPRVPVDPTLELTSADADVVILNHGTLEGYYKRLGGLARGLGLEVFPGRIALPAC